MHFLLRDIQLTEGSVRSSGFFLKIEEAQLIAFLTLYKKIQPEMVLDIGANVGFYSLATSKFFPNSTIWSFEPTPKTFAELCNNISLNEKTNQIRAHQIALSDTQTVVEFLDYDNLSGRNGVRETSFHNPTQAATIAVQTETLDHFLGDWKGTALVKIDTEGHEPNVLKGGSNFFRKNNCIIQAEAQYNAKTSKNKTQETLLSLGYFKIISIGPDDYYSNIQSFRDDRVRVELLEEVIAHQLDIRWHDKFTL